MLVTWTWTCCRGCHALPGNVCWLSGHQNRLCHIINKQTKMCNISGPYHPSHPLYTHKQALKHTQKRVCSGACARAHTGTNTHRRTHRVHMSEWRAGVCWFLWKREGEIRMGRPFHRTSRRQQQHDSWKTERVCSEGSGCEQPPGGPGVNECHCCFVSVETFLHCLLSTYRWLTVMKRKSLPAGSLKLPYGLFNLLSVSIIGHTHTFQPQDLNEYNNNNKNK